MRRPRARTQLPPCAWHAPRGGRERGGRGGAAASPQAVLSPPQVGAGGWEQHGKSTPGMGR